MKVSQLKKNKANPRQIKGEKLELLKKSVGSFQKMMELRPMIVDENFVVLGGNMRLAAIKALGLKEIPDSWVRQVTDLTEDEKKEFIIKDNNSFGEYDWDAIANEWSDLPLADWGLDVPGFEAIDEPEGDADAEPQIDKAAELNKKWKVKSGDLWQIGSHRLICGDSTSPQAVERVLDGAKPNLMVTDPPYGVEYDPTWRDGKGAFGIEFVTMRGRVDNDDRSDWSEAYKLFPGNVVYMWHASKFAAIVEASLALSEFEIRNQIIWKKPHFAMSRGNYHWQHEPCFYAVKHGQKSNWLGDRSQTTVWDISSLNPVAHGGEEKLGHGTQKPLECMARPIRNHEGDVYEPFAGSGTTLVACQNLNRKCYAIEISENYCAVILERMQTAFPDIEIKRIENAKTKGTT